MNENWTNEFKSITQQYVDAFGELSTEEMNWKINAEKWSIAQVIDHIITTNETYYPKFKSIKEGSNSTPLFFSWSPMVNFTEKMIWKALLPDRKKRMKTFQVWEPSNSDIASNIIEKLKVNEGEMQEHFLSLQAHIKSGIKVSSPAKKIVVYSLAFAFEAVLLHEKRHLNQAMEVLDQMKLRK